jgi:3-oxoacyl-[acyl-carrier protein] reductase
MAGEPVVLVSGGSRGLGQALVKDLLAHGWRVATFSRTATPFIDESSLKHPHALFWRSVDASDFAAARDFVNATTDRWGHLDGLVNNAAISRDGLLTLQDEASIHQTLTINLESVIHLTRAGVRTMLPRRSGSVVNISSIHALRGHAGVSVYSATKAALIGLTRSLAHEVGESGIRVNAVAAGFFESDMVAQLTQEQRRRIVQRTPLGRLGTAADVAGVVRFLLSAEANFLTGQTITVDGGLTC